MGLVKYIACNILADGSKTKAQDKDWWTDLKSYHQCNSALTLLGWFHLWLFCKGLQLQLFLSDQNTCCKHTQGLLSSHLQISVFKNSNFA